MRATQSPPRIAGAHIQADPMPVVVICEGMNLNGGVANVAWNQAIRLASKHPVIFLSDGFSEERLHSDSGVSCLKVKSPKFHFLRRYSHMPRMLGFILKAQRMVERSISMGQPFVLICHSHPTAAIAGWWLKRWREAIVIMISHGDIFDRPPNSYDRYLTWFYKVMTPRAYRRADGIVAISPHMADTMRRYGVDIDKVHLIPNGINPREIGVFENVVPRNSDHGPLKLLFVGRIEPIKGLDCLVAGCEELDRRGIDFTLAIAGKGSSTYLNQLKQRIQRAGLQNRIEWIGSVPREKLFSLYSQHHILIVPSINDPCPLVVLESMASGLPVVGSNVGGIPMMVEAGETGFTVPAEDPLALSNAISKLGQDRTLLAKMAVNSVERAKLFSWERNVEGLSEMIDLLDHTAAVKR